MFGKPELIRIEVARDVGKSKREREEISKGIAKNERKRKEAVKDLESKGVSNPAHKDIEKWLLWKEGQERCPYTGDQISFDALFREGRYQVEHIWPRSISFDDSFRNKTLCRRDVNIKKNNRTPFQALSSDADVWAAIKNRLQGLIVPGGMSPGKMKRFLAESVPEDFTSRQLNDTGYAARQAMAFLKRLWPDVGPQAPVKVEAVTGSATAQLRKLWNLNNILAADGEKTRADHRHHAIDALTIACTHPGMTNKLSRYWQQRDDINAPKPTLLPPWSTIRIDAERAIADVIVSHRVRKKVSGPLHKETIYGDTKNDEKTKIGTYRLFVTRKKVESLSRRELDDIVDKHVQGVVKSWVAARGGDPKKAFPPYPRIGEKGSEIRRVRLTTKQQITLMARVGNGYADLGSNHHIAIYRLQNGKSAFEVVSLFEASRRLAKHESIIRRSREDDAVFTMSLAPGDALKFAKQDSEKVKIWRVQKIASKGQISLLDHTDASTEEFSLFEPMVGGLMSRKAEKISIDPIGRVRPAND